MVHLLLAILAASSKGLLNSVAPDFVGRGSGDSSYRGSKLLKTQPRRYTTVD